MQSLLGLRRCCDRPVQIGAEGMINEKGAGAVSQLSMHLQRITVLVLYAAPAYLDRQPSQLPLPAHKWLGFEQRLSQV